MRPCASCSHPQRKEIDRKIKSGSPLADIERWLATTELAIGEEALRRHRQQHIVGGSPPSGPRPRSGTYLEAVIDNSWAGLESGETRASIQNGIAAQAEINRMADRQSDRNLLLQMAQVLGGGLTFPAIEGEYREWDEQEEQDEAEFQKLLTPGG